MFATLRDDRARGPQHRRPLTSLARLLPYRTAEDRIDGAVLNFVDVTACASAEDSVGVGEERMRAGRRDA